MSGAFARIIASGTPRPSVSSTGAGHIASGMPRPGVLLHEELDPAAFLALGHTKDWAFITISSNSKTSSEVRSVRMP